MKKLLFLAAVAWLTACDDGNQADIDKTNVDSAATDTLTDKPEPVDPMVLYTEAVKDAEIAEPDEAVKALIDLTDNQELMRDDSGRIAVLTWSSWDGYAEAVGQPMDMGRETWVTVVPELKEFCGRLRLDSLALRLRLQQVLGLPPKDEARRIVMLWVSPDDLFRPCPDPEVTDSSCYISVAELKAAGRQPDTAHLRRFNDLKAKSYATEGGYPWTRLGYTYDWAPGAPDEIGLSEFIIPAGTRVTIASVQSTVAYCSAN